MLSYILVCLKSDFLLIWVGILIIEFHRFIDLKIYQHFNGWYYYICKLLHIIYLQCVVISGYMFLEILFFLKVYNECFTLWCLVILDLSLFNPGLSYFENNFKTTENYLNKSLQIFFRKLIQILKNYKLNL